MKDDHIVAIEVPASLLASLLDHLSDEVEFYRDDGNRDPDTCSASEWVQKRLAAELLFDQLDSEVP